VTRSKTLGALAVALLLTGCARTGAGAAARIGDHRVTTASLTRHVDRALADRRYAQRADRADVQRGWLSQLVKAHLYREAARRLGAEPSKAELTKAYEEFLESEGGKQNAEQVGAANGIAPQDLREVIEASVYLDAAGDALVKDLPTTDDQLRTAYAARLKEFDVSHLAHIRIADKATADKVAAQVRGGGDFAALAKQFSVDTQSAPDGGDIGQLGNGQGRFEKSIEAVLFAPTVRTGSIVGPVQVQGGFEIFKVIERKTLAYEDAKVAVRRGVLAEQRGSRLNEYLTKLVRELGLSVNPRFGQWDAQRLTIVATADQLSAPEESPGAVQPGVVQPGGQPTAPAPATSAPAPAATTPAP
jgi:foldase protein PrsA